MGMGGRGAQAGQRERRRNLAPGSPKRGTQCPYPLYIFVPPAPRASTPPPPDGGRTTLDPRRPLEPPDRYSS